MKHLLLGTAAIALGLALSVPAQAADGVKLGVGGYFKGYVSWLDQDTTPDDPGTVGNEGEDVRNFEIVRDTEIHFTGETTLDNGLTVGFHTELEDDVQNSFDVQESYAYFSGVWGRINLGAEDGAAYLLQVAAPSADNNIDGLRQYVNPVNYDTFMAGSTTFADVNFDDFFNGVPSTVADDFLIVDADGDDARSADDVLLGSALGGTAISGRLDYDQAVTGFDDKITYLTPVFSGFQAGVSYTPNLDGTSIDAAGLDGHTTDGDVGEWGDAWDVAVRYEGQWNAIGVTVGAGYSHAALEEADGAAAFYRDENGDGDYDAGGDTILATLDDRTAWNVGGNINWSAFNLGIAYINDDNGVSDDYAEGEAWTTGLDYTSGPFKVGGSYYTSTLSLAQSEVTAERWTGGAVYTYGPGMTFRGSISFLDLEEDVGANLVNESEDVEATSFLIGTQIDF